MFIDLRPIPPISFRHATEDDVDFLYAMHVATMKEYVDQTWGWDDAFQESVFQKNYVPAEIRVVTFEGKNVGMISLEEREEDIFLRAIEILPSHQGQGIGARIVQQIITETASKQKPVLLYVLKVNPTKGLYERLGFSAIEETDTHFIMKISLPK